MRERASVGIRIGFLALLLLSLAGTASAGPIVHVYTALAPNAYGSPSFPTWEQNAVNAMKNGGIATGTPGTPTYFQLDGWVTSAEAVVTGFPSWMGTTDPGAVFGAAFANELGNRMTFPLWIEGAGTQFSISQLSFEGVSSDFYNGLGFGWAAGEYNYSSGYVGLNYGADGKKGTADDSLITGGPNTQLVDELFGRGSGNSYPAYCTGCTPAEQQAALDSIAAYPGSLVQLTGTYTLTLPQDGVYTGSATFNVLPVPDAGTTFTLLSLSLLGLGVLRRRSRG